MGLLAFVRAALIPGELADTKSTELRTYTDGSLWVRPVPGATAAPAARTPVASQALVASQVLKAAPGTVFGITVQLGTAASGADTMATGTYYVLLLDAAAAPSSPATVAPKAVLVVDHTLGTRDLVSVGDEVGGLAMASGGVVVLSTTGPTTYTAAGAYMLCNGSVL